MRLLPVLLSCALLAQPVMAGDYIVVIQKDGSAWVSENGTTIVVPRDHVVLPPGCDQPDPGPGPDPDPDPDPPTGFPAQVKLWSDAIDDPITARLLAGTYALMSDQIENGTIPNNTDFIDGALNLLVERAISKSPSPLDKEDEWNSFHDDHIAPAMAIKIAGGGGSLEVGEWVAFMNDVEEGLLLSAGGNVILDTILQMIIDVLLPALLEWLLNQIAQGTFEAAEEALLLDPADDGLTLSWEAYEDQIMAGLYQVRREQHLRQLETMAYNWR